MYVTDPEELYRKWSRENSCNKIRICVKQASVQDHLQKIQLCFGEAGEEGANLIWDLQLEKLYSWNT